VALTVASSERKTEYLPPERFDLAQLNLNMGPMSAEEIVKKSYAFSEKVMTSTTFGHQSAVILHMVTRIKPNAKILWVDTGYNTSATYRFADRLIERLKLNIEIYAPEMTSTRRNVMLGVFPMLKIRGMKNLPAK